MSGEELKEILYQAHISQARIAAALGIPKQSVSQALLASDIKTGFLERICKALNLKMSFFYPEIAEGSSIVNTNVGHQHAKNLANGTQNIGADADLVSQLMNQLKEQQNQIAKLTDMLLRK